MGVCLLACASLNLLPVFVAWLDAQVVFETPPGIKMNLQRTYSSWSTVFLAGQATTPAAAAGTSSSSISSLAPVPAALVPLRAQLLFLLAWFNAVVQERRNYVPFVSAAC